MKDLLRQYANYNVWANQKLVDTVLMLSPDQLVQEIPSSFTSIHKTIFHMWDAESIWWQRLRLQERVIVPSETYEIETKEACTGFIQQSRQWEEWVAASSENAIQHVVAYYNSRKEHFKQPVHQLVLHVFNHSTYHRGQLVNMLRQLGVTKIPQTDFIIWSRSKKT